MKKLYLLLLSACLSFISTANATTNATAAWQKEQAAGVSYWLYTPAAAAGSPRGLMVNLHGCTQTADDLKQAGNWEAAAEQYHLAVAIPFVPNGGVILGCWDYYGTDQNAGNRDNAPLIGLTEALLQRADLGIDKTRVYISGISSGAGQAMVEGCLRPDLFRGVGLAASPAAGTGSNNIFQPNLNAHQVAQFCRSLAGSHSFAGQQISLIHGDQDFIVNPQHSQLIVDAYTEIFGLQAPESLPTDILPGTHTAGTIAGYRDAAGEPRLSLIVNQGLGHAWPAGNGTQAFALKYIMQNSVDYPAYLGSFFAPLSGTATNPSPAR